MKLKNVIFLVLIFGVQLAFSEKKELDLETVIDLAIKNNTGLKIKYLDTAFQKITRDTAWNVIIPSLALGSTLSRLHEAPIQFAMNGNTPIIETGENWGIQFSFAANLNLNAALVHGIIYSGMQYASGLIDLDSYKRRLVRDVKKNFYNLILMEQNINLYKQSLETAGKRYEQAKLYFESGASSLFQMLTAQVTYENLKPGLKEMENGYQIALLNFKNILNLQSDEDIVLLGEIEMIPVSLDANKLIHRYLLQNPDLQFLSKSIESIEIQRRGEIVRNYTPTLTLSLSFDPAFTGNPFTDNWFADPENDWMQRQGMFATTLSYNLEGLLPGSATRVRLAELKKEKEKLEFQFEQAVRATELEIRTLVRGMEKAAESLANLDLNVQLAQKAFEIATQGYGSGVRELLEIENAEDELNKAKLEVLKEKYNYTANLSDLEYVLNFSTEQLKEVQDEK
jgi:outer membrane protein TolC